MLFQLIKVSLFSTLFVLTSPLAQASDLVDVQWLQANSATLKIIDLRSPERFQMGHIPHAINIPYEKFTRSKNGVTGFVEAPIIFKNLMQQYGVNNSDAVVLYSDWSFLESMRIYWVFDLYGHKQIRVLDGGLQAWEKINGKLSMDEKKIKISHYTVEINADILTTKFRTFMATKNPNYIIVDGRGRKQFKGDTSLTQRKGHIPGAVNLPWMELIKKRKQSDLYERLDEPSVLEDLNVLKQKLAIIPRDKKVVLYCNGGQESSVLYFALKSQGISASIYDGSWFEWSADKKMPVVKGQN